MFCYVISMLVLSFGTVMFVFTSTYVVILFRCSRYLRHESARLSQKGVHQDAIRFVVMNLFVMIIFDNLFSLL